MLIRGVRLCLASLQPFLPLGSVFQCQGMQTCMVQSVLGQRGVEGDRVFEFSHGLCSVGHVTPADWLADILSTADPSLLMT